MVFLQKFAGGGGGLHAAAVMYSICRYRIKSVGELCWLSWPNVYVICDTKSFAHHCVDCAVNRVERMRGIRLVLAVSLD